MTVFVLGRDSVGIVAEDRDPGYKDGPFRYYLTECCGASAKGMENYIGCRSCYEEIDPAIGGTPDRAVVLVKQSKDDKPEGAICYDEVVGPGWWVSQKGTLDLIEVFGDGIPYDEWKKTLV